MKILESISTEFKNSLINIVNKIEIVENFSFSHQDYIPFKITSEMVTKLQKLSLNFQKQYLVSQLRNYLADIYFHGCSRKLNSKVSEISLPLENNSMKGINCDFYDRLETNNYGRGYFDSNWLVIREEDDGSLAVQKNNLTFHIQRDIHLSIQDIQAKLNDLVAIKLPHNCWQDEFYVAISNNGAIDFSESQQQEIIEIYFNATSEAAIILMAKLTRQLNALKVTFTLKVLDNPNNYPCYDAVILTILSDDYLMVTEVIKNLYLQIKLHLYPETPLCTFKLAPGISLAEATKEGFANSCCRAIANGLLTAWYEKKNSPQYRLQYIEAELFLANVNIQYPYLNSNFERIYHRLF